MSVGEDIGFPAEVFERNLIGGVWRFPKAPYEFDVRSPVTSEIIATVPLSSQLDVRQAAAMARQAASGWVDLDHRCDVLGAFFDQLQHRAFDLATLQSEETGLCEEDSLAFSGALLEITRMLLERSRHDSGSNAIEGRVEGHILGWAAPLIELATTVLPVVFSGVPVVVKPSIRAPLTIAAVANMLNEAGVPAGIVNVVQGLGTDVGSAIAIEPAINRLCVRGATSTVEAVNRTAVRRGADCSASDGQSQVLLIGADADPSSAVQQLSRGLRANSFGAPLMFSTAVVHRSILDEVIDAIASCSPSLAPAPLPTAAARRSSLQVVAEAVADGGVIRLGALDVPADARHRMGWFQLPTVIEVDATNVVLGRRALGPVLVVVPWETGADLACVLERHDPDVALFTQALDPSVISMPHQDRHHDIGPGDLLFEGHVASGWANRPAAEVLAGR